MENFSFSGTGIIAIAVLAISLIVSIFVITDNGVAYKKRLKLPSPYTFKDRKQRQRYRLLLYILKKEDKLNTFFYYLKKHKTHKTLEAELRSILDRDSFFKNIPFLETFVKVLPSEARFKGEKILFEDLSYYWEPFIRQQRDIMDIGFVGYKTCMHGRIGYSIRTRELGIVNRYSVSLLRNSAYFGISNRY